MQSEDDLWAEIEALVLGDPGHKEQRQAIIAEQKALKALVSEKTWQQYLRIEALANARNGALLVKVAWASRD